jgi:hypothetical protein
VPRDMEAAVIKHTIMILAHSAAVVLILSV